MDVWKLPATQQASSVMMSLPLGWELHVVHVLLGTPEMEESVQVESYLKIINHE